MEVIMNINRLILFFIVILASTVSVTLPVNADVITISFKPNVKYNKCASINIKKNSNNASARKVTLNGSRSTHCYSPRKVGKFSRPKMGGVRVDACVHGTGWKKSNPQRCDASRLDIIANDFCRSKGYKKSILVSKGLHKGKHAVLTFKKGRSSNSFWKRKEGKSVIDIIYCE